MPAKVLINLLCYNSITTHGVEALCKSIDSVLAQQNIDFDFIVADNYSSDQTWDKLKENCSNKNVTLYQHAQNLGYAAAQNHATGIFLSNNYDFLLCTTHDVYLEQDCIFNLVKFAEAHKKIILTPIFYRADAKLKELMPRQIDAAGMYLSKGLRHFDLEAEPMEDSSKVFGATGAAIFFDRVAIEKLLLKGERYDFLSGKIYPQLNDGRSQRAPLFDEAFFAYREDADLSWRANLLNVDCYCIKSAKALHIRHVLPERRASLSSEINYWSVRNRFLLQINNYHYKKFPEAFLSGVIFRNIFVIIAVLIKERSSLKAFRDLWILRKRAFERRALLVDRLELKN
jgi:GT2 family glycosyltransferase